MRNRLGFLLLFSGCTFVIFSGFYLAMSESAYEWLVYVLVQYFGLVASAQEYIRWLVYSFSNLLIMAGVVILIGAIIWLAGPRRPHAMADLILAIAKIMIAFGASIMTIPIALQTLGIMVASIFTIEGAPINGLNSVLVSLVNQLISLVFISLGSLFITKQ